MILYLLLETQGTIYMRRTGRGNEEGERVDEGTGHYGISLIASNRPRVISSARNSGAERRRTAARTAAPNRGCLIGLITPAARGSRAQIRYSARSSRTFSGMLRLSPAPRAELLCRFRERFDRAPQTILRPPL